MQPPRVQAQAGLNIAVGVGELDLTMRREDEPRRPD
jgi:hypothetical protein